MNLINDIQEIVKEFITQKYFEYLDDNNLLIVIDEQLNDIIKFFYNDNSKILKNIIREKLKVKMGEEYPAASVENIILDIFQDYKFNINKIVINIKKYQDDNFLEINKPIGVDGLGLNISIDGSYCLINNIKSNFIETNNAKKQIIDKYKYIYSINDFILDKANKNIDILKDNILQDSVVKLMLYELK
tara:strand:- start:2270 stop:2833 length:564 start_codon:yes stop_codon:yes gene_type:complete